MTLRLVTERFDPAQGDVLRASLQARRAPTLCVGITLNPASYGTGLAARYVLRKELVCLTRKRCMLVPPRRP